ncbi:MAG: O-antigen ligase family protein [Anaerolineae bacterium]
MRHLINVIARYELLLLGAATPFLLFPGKWTPIGLALIAVAWIARWGATGRISARTAMDVPIVLLLIMTGVSLIPSIALDLSLNRMWVIILGVALFYGVVNGLHTERHIHYMGIALVFVGLIVAIVGLLGTDWEIGALIELPAIYTRLPGPVIRGLPGSGVIEEYDLINPRVVAGALAIVLPVPLAYVILGQGHKLRLLSGCTALAMAAVLALTQAPQGLLGLAAALFLIGVWRSRWFLVSLPVGLGGLFTAARFVAAQQAQVGWLAPETIDTLDFGIRSRLVNGARGIGIVRDMPYTGIGLNTFPVVEGLYTSGASHAEHAHNLLIQTAVDLGVVGLAAVLALLAAFAYTVAHAYRASRNRNQRALLIGICGAVLAWLTYGLLDSITLGHKPGVAIWVALGLAAASRLQLEQPAKESVPFLTRFSRRWLALVILPLVLLLAMVGLTARNSIGAFYVNLGVMESHRAMADPASPTSVATHRDAAEEYFRLAIRWDPARGRAHRLLEWTLSEDILRQRWPRETL